MRGRLFIWQFKQRDTPVGPLCRLLGRCQASANEELFPQGKGTLSMAPRGNDIKTTEGEEKDKSFLWAPVGQGVL